MAVRFSTSAIWHSRHEADRKDFGRDWSRFEPQRIKRLAKAEVEANKSRALGDIEVSELQRRVLQRLAVEEGVRQPNIETITRLAIEDVKPDAKPENIDPDWIAHFFDRSRLISDAEMQTFWGRSACRRGESAGRVLEAHA
jgi:hypothetical protein